MSKEYEIKVLDAPKADDTRDKSENPNLSWIYSKGGVPVNDFDRQDLKEKESIKALEYKKWWETLTEQEQFAVNRETTAGEGRPDTMTVEEWNTLPKWKKAWYRGLDQGSQDAGFYKDVSVGAAIGVKNALVNAFSLPLEMANVINDTDAAKNFNDWVASVDPLQPENSTQALVSIFAQYGVPSIAVLNWMNKFKKAPGFWNALGRYVRNIGTVGVTDAIVSGPGDINLATAFGDNYPVPFEQLLTIHENDPSLVKRAKIGSEMIYVGPLVDTALMIGGGLYKGSKFIFGNSDTGKKIEYTDINGVEQSFYTSERTFNAVSKILNDMSEPRSLEEIEATLKVFQNSGIIPPTGAASGTESLIHLQNLFSGGNYSDVTLKNLLAMNENVDTLLKQMGLADGINSKFLSSTIQKSYDDITAKIAQKENTIKSLKDEQTGTVSEAKTKLQENESILNRELTELKEQRKNIEIDINNQYVNDFNAAKDEVLAYLNKVGQYDPGTMNQLAHSLDEELINQFTYLTYYKNQLYKNIDVDPTTGTKIVHNIKNFDIGDKDSVFSFFKKDVKDFTKKRRYDDTVAGRIPSYLTKELNLLISPKNKDPLTITRLEELRSTFTRAYKEAIDNNDTLLATRIQESKYKIFENLYNNIGKSKNPAAVGMADRAQSASNWFKNEYAPRFEEGIGSMWAEAFKKRKSGSLFSSSPEQSPLYFIMNDGRGKTINNSSESGINQLENILNRPKDELNKDLIAPIADPLNPNKILNVADKENAVKIVENFFAAQIAKSLQGQTNPTNAMKILDKMLEDYYPILQKYPNIAKQINEYKDTIKLKYADQIQTKSTLDASNKFEKEETIKQLNNKKTLIDEFKTKEKTNIESITADFKTKIEIASDELKLLQNEKNANLNLFSFFIDDSAVGAVSKAMDSPNPEEALALIRQKVVDINIPEVTKGLDEAISQWLSTQIHNPSLKIPTSANVKYEGMKFEVDLVGLDAILSNPNKVKALEAAGWGADEIATLIKFSDQLSILERSNIGARSGRTKSNILDEEQYGRKAKILAASIYGIVKGRGIMALMNLVGGALGISPMKAQTMLLQDAMTHPELAKIMMMNETEQSLKLLNTYILNNYGNVPDTMAEFTEDEPREYRIQEINQFNVEPDNIEPVSQMNILPDPVNVNVPTVNNASRLASTNFMAPLNANTGAINPNTMAKGSALFSGPREITFAAQGGIMNARKQIQRVA